MSDHTFNWQKARKHTLETKIHRCKMMAGGPEREPNPDYKLKYPAECKDAVKGDYTLMLKRLKQEEEIYVKKALDSREKKRWTKFD